MFWSVQKKRRHRGASLIEVLVVIVIFTVGILGLVQIFPTGLGILRQTRNNTIATSLARAEAENLKANVEQLPESVLPAEYVWAGGQWALQTDLNRRVDDLTPIGQGPRADGTLYLPDGDLGYWPYFSGANVVRRVVGEGRRVPAPRFVETSLGTLYGGLMTLQFAPVLIDPAFITNFLIYGNDLNKAWLEEIDATTFIPMRRRNPDGGYFIDEDGTFMSLPQGPTRADAPTFQRQFRVSASVRYSGGSGVERRSLVVVVNVPQASSQNRFFIPFDLSTIFAQPGLTFINAEPDTIQVQRLYEQTTTFLTDAQVGGSSALQADAAYQCLVLDRRLGAILFNPIASTYSELRRSGALPQSARVDYDVLDWRNIRDDFRVPNVAPFQQKLILDSIRVKGNRGVDALIYNGIGMAVQNGSGGTEQRDVIVFDRDTGGIYQPNSYRVDKSLGLITFVDVDNAAGNGLSADIIFAGATAPVRVADIRNRAVRAIYQSAIDLAVQVQKATGNYRVTDSATLGYAQCYVGGSNASVGVDDPTRIYFPLCDIGKKVVVGEIWYQNGSGTPLLLGEQEFIIRGPGPAEWGANAYIDINEKAAGALGFDFSRGYAVRRVRGASVQVRVVWNPTGFTLVGDEATNRQRLSGWLGQSRTSITETFLMRGEIQ